MTKNLDILNIIIMAAGKGSRMRSQIPKVLHKIAGKTLLNHVLSQVKKLNFKRIIVVIGHEAEKVKNSVEPFEGLEFVYQKQLLGTGDAVKIAFKKIEKFEEKNSFNLILNSDIPLIKTETLEELIQDKKDLNLLTVKLNDPSGYGRVLRNKNNQVIKIIEDKDANNEELKINEIYSGIMLASNSFLKSTLNQLKNDNLQKEFYITDLIKIASEQNVLINTKVINDKTQVLGINDSFHLTNLERIFQLEQAKRLMENFGLRLIDISRFDLRGELICGQDIEIDINCILEGKIKIGNNVKIGANCVIKNVEIASNSEILPFSHIEGAKIGQNVKIGPFARIRPQSEIGNNAHIGNFVEIKNSIINQNSKANHLAYIGDSQVGENINFGAGSITANYDGINKNKTIIKDNVQVGSNCVLIAPIIINENATIAAGSVITKEVPSNNLSISRNQQINKLWNRQKKKN